MKLNIVRTNTEYQKAEEKAGTYIPIVDNIVPFSDVEQTFIEEFIKQLNISLAKINYNTD
jgi:hypothetical protein